MLEVEIPQMTVAYGCGFSGPHSNEKNEKPIWQWLDEIQALACTVVHAHTAPAILCSLMTFSFDFKILFVFPHAKTIKL